MSTEARLREAEDQGHDAKAAGVHEPETKKPRTTATMHGQTFELAYSNGIITIAGMRVRPEEAATIRDFLTMVLNCHGLEGRSESTGMRGVDHFALGLACSEIWQAVRQPDPRASLRRAIQHIQSVLEPEETAAPGPQVRIR